MLKRNKGAGSRSREAAEEKKLRDAEETTGSREAAEEKKLRDAEETRGSGTSLTVAGNRVTQIGEALSCKREKQR